MLMLIAITRSYGAFTNSIGMIFVEIPPVAGSSKIPESNQQDRTARAAEIKNPSSFWIGITEVTQAQWESIMQTNPSYHKGSNLPVEMVSWNSAVDFCKRLGARDGMNYRLPTEAEWCFACDGGKELKPDDLREVAWTLDNATNTMPVGLLNPNGFGLYDMHGNVAEWCSDDYPLIWTNALIEDIRHPAKGGSVGYFRKDSVISARQLYCGRKMEYRNSLIGFRVICVKQLAGNRKINPYD